MGEKTYRARTMKEALARVPQIWAVMPSSSPHARFGAGGFSDSVRAS